MPLLRHRRRSRGNSSVEALMNASNTIRVKSVHAAQTLDVVKVLAKVFGVTSSMPPVRHMFGKTSVIVQLSPPPSDEEAQPRFVAVYRFGSVVFFNMSPRDTGKLLEEIKMHGSGAISSGFERKEHFEVLVQPSLQDLPHVVNGDFCVVQDLDMNATAVISSIMAQTVALDSYSDIVDQLLANFASINSTVTRTGSFTEMERSSLFQVVSQNNSVFIDMISKLGIKDRSDTAWNMSQFEKVHEVSSC
ncbi:putative ACR [Fragilaria crotonensis]|nr:putative ACR [Fragilaria crotonensis]